MNVQTGVSALQPVQRDAQSHIAFSHIRLHELPHAVHCRAACAADADLAFLLGVEVYHQVAVYVINIESRRAEHACLLVHSEEQFQRTMLRRCRRSHSRRHSYAVVGAERRALGRKPLHAVLGYLLGQYRVLGPVVLHALGGLRHHVHVRLKANAPASLSASRRRHLHYHAASLVAEGAKAVVLSPVQDIAAHCIHMPRRTRNFA